MGGTPHLQVGQRLASNIKSPLPTLSAAPGALNAGVRLGRWGRARASRPPGPPGGRERGIRRPSRTCTTTETPNPSMAGWDRWMRICDDPLPGRGADEIRAREGVSDRIRVPLDLLPRGLGAAQPVQLSDESPPPSPAPPSPTRPSPPPRLLVPIGDQSPTLACRSMKWVTPKPTSQIPSSNWARSRTQSSMHSTVRAPRPERRQIRVAAPRPRSMAKAAQDHIFSSRSLMWIREAK